MSMGTGDVCRCAASFRLRLWCVSQGVTWRGHAARRMARPRHAKPGPLVLRSWGHAALHSARWLPAEQSRVGPGHPEAPGAEGPAPANTRAIHRPAGVHRPWLERRPGAVHAGRQTSGSSRARRPASAFPWCLRSLYPVPPSLTPHPAPAMAISAPTVPFSPGSGWRQLSPRTSPLERSWPTGQGERRSGVP